MVEGGETLEVTDRGRPVALISPVPRASGLDALEAAGRLIRAEGDLLDLGDPISAKRGEPTLSEVLESMRRDER